MFCWLLGCLAIQLKWAPAGRHKLRRKHTTSPLSCYPLLISSHKTFTSPGNADNVPSHVHVDSGLIMLLYWVIIDKILDSATDCCCTKWVQSWNVDCTNKSFANVRMVYFSFLATWLQRCRGRVRQQTNYRLHKKLSTTEMLPVTEQGAANTNYLSHLLFNLQ